MMMMNDDNCMQMRTESNPGAGNQMYSTLGKCCTGERSRQSSGRGRAQSPHTVT